MSLTLKRRVTVLATVISVMLVAGVVFAAWTSDGAGSGSVGAGTSEDSTIVAATGSADALYPGATGTMKVTINNPNPYHVTVNSITAGASDAVGDCAAGIVTSAALTPAANVIAPLTGTQTFDLAVTMSDDATNACKGQTFSLDLDAVLSSVPAPADSE